MPRLRASVLALLLLYALLAIGCTASSETQTVRLTEVIRSVFYAPMYVAINKGFFRDEGLDVELNTAWGGDKAAAAVISHNADIALIGPETTIYVYTQGASNKLVSFAQLTAMDGSFFVGRYPQQNFVWQDVKELEVIGGRKGGLPQMVLEAVFKKNGIHPNKDIHMTQTIQYDMTTAAYKAGVGDFVQIYEPGASILEKDGSGFIVASLGKAAGNMPFTNFLTTEKFLRQEPQTIQKFTNAIYKAQVWTYAHSPEEIAECISSFFSGVDREILICAISRYQEQETWAKTPLVSAEEFDHLQDIMVLAAELKEKVPFEKVVNTSFAHMSLSQAH